MAGSAVQFETKRTFRAEPAAAGKARALLEQTLAVADLAPWYEALLVTSELVTNAVCHGSRAGDRIFVSFTFGQGRLRIRVRDAARGRGLPVQLTPHEERPAGRGLSIVAHLAEWSERVIDGRREVSAELTRTAHAHV